MHVLVTCKNEDDSIKSEGAIEISKQFSIMSMEIFPDAQGQLTLPFWPNFELVLDVMGVLLICKNIEDPIKNESARVVTRFSAL